MKAAYLVVTLAISCLAASWLAVPPAQAQQAYCAFYNDGTQSCGIPTLQSCEDSVRGVGGMCHPDDSAQIPENFFQRWRDAQRANNIPSSPALDNVPPPPGLSLTPTGPVGPPPAMYCANFNNGTQTCGIGSLAECEDTVRGVGGMCQPQ